MNAGNLNQPITIQRMTQTPDMMGGFTEVWADLQSAWAMVTPKSGREAMDQGRPNATFVVVFTIYTIDGLRDADRIMWGGVPYNIRGILGTGHNSLFTKVEAERGVAS